MIQQSEANKQFLKELPGLQRSFAWAIDILEVESSSDSLSNYWFVSGGFGGIITLTQCSWLITKSSKNVIEDAQVFQEKKFRHFSCDISGQGIENNVYTSYRPQKQFQLTESEKIENNAKAILCLKVGRHRQDNGRQELFCFIVVGTSWNQIYKIDFNLIEQNNKYKVVTKEGNWSTQIYALSPHRDAVNTVDICAEKSIIVSGGDDLSIKIQTFKGEVLYEYNCDLIVGIVRFLSQDAIAYLGQFENEDSSIENCLGIIPFHDLTKDILEFKTQVFQKVESAQQQQQQPQKIKNFQVNDFILQKFNQQGSDFKVWLATSMGICQAQLKIEENGNIQKSDVDVYKKTEQANNDKQQTQKKRVIETNLNEQNFVQAAQQAIDSFVYIKDINIVYALTQNAPTQTAHNQNADTQKNQLYKLQIDHQGVLRNAKQQELDIRTYRLATIRQRDNAQNQYLIDFGSHNEQEMNEVARLDSSDTNVVYEIKVTQTITHFLKNMKCVQFSDCKTPKSLFFIGGDSLRFIELTL